MAKKVKLTQLPDGPEWVGTCVVCEAWCIEGTKANASTAAHKHWKEEHGGGSVSDEMQEAPVSTDG